ncbi:MAG TPA: aspartate ammonia-lyase [Thermoanaerobaculia bacterium]|nr:aspartate ammonia-lyase [Thermoanaerobaculia bacterium]
MPADAAGHRIERDTLGEVRVPAGALYGAQTQRAVENYPVSGLREHPQFIRAFILLKKAAALANKELGTLESRLADAIVSACDLILGDLRGYRQHFVVDVFQAGAGTSFNMNCNEVLANLANRSLGGELGSYKPIHPNDHVNMAQSTNDVFPTAIRMAVVLQLAHLLPVIESLQTALAEKGSQFADVIKSGRTHLQDAVPVTLGQEFAAYSRAVARAHRLLIDAAAELFELGIGGTAAGTGMNTAPGYRHAVVRHLNDMTGQHYRPANDLREAMQSQLPVVAVSTALRNLALELTRITNDLRLLASGPQTGLAEIVLPSVQPGSSIMPGKVNPSLLECMNQICFHVIGADTAVAYASQAGQLELNVMMPLMAFELNFSIEILNNFIPVFVEKCVRGIEADRERCREYYISSPSLATALNPIIGYAAAAEIAKESARSGRPIPDLIRERGLLSEEEIHRIFSPEFLTGQADQEMDL